LGEVTLGTIRLPYLVSDVDRHGNVRHYVRIKGRPKARLEGAPGSQKFMAGYAKATAGMGTTVRRTAEGTFRALCTMYYASAAFRALDISTQKWRRRALDRICAEKDGGYWPYRDVDAHAIKALRDELEDKPVVANTRMKALRALFGWAVAKDHLDSDPTRGVKGFSVRSTGHHTWTIEEVQAFEARHPIGTRARLAMALMFYTTGRREDAVRLGPQHVRGGRVQFTQAKNEHRSPVAVDIPLRPELAKAIEACPSGHLTFLVTEYGRPFTPAGFGNWFRKQCDDAGLPHCSAHGLRKAMATRLADLGASPHGIMSVTGHQSLTEAERYTKAANRAKLATATMSLLDGGTLSAESLDNQRQK
jgi:integrase/recombinase XerD